MSGYTPVFDSIYDGTLCGKWLATQVFLTFLSLCDKNGEVDKTLEAIALRTAWNIDQLKQGIEELMQSDPGSRTKSEEGRRLVLIDPDREWGWRVVNHGYYREKCRLAAKDASRTESGANAERMRQARADQAGEKPAEPVKPALVSRKANKTRVKLTDGQAKRLAKAAEPTTDRFGNVEKLKLVFCEPVSGVEDYDARFWIGTCGICQQQREPLKSQRSTLRLPGQPPTRDELLRAAKAGVQRWRRSEARNEGRPRRGQRFTMVSFDDEQHQINAEDAGSYEDRHQLNEDILT
jgi:hypothetical protein